MRNTENYICQQYFLNYSSDKSRSFNSQETDKTHRSYHGKTKLYMKYENIATQVRMYIIAFRCVYTIYRIFITPCQLAQHLIHKIDHQSTKAHATTHSLIQLIYNFLLI